MAHSNNGPSKTEMLRWQAEDVVRTAVTSTPEFKKAVTQTMAELKKVQAKAAKTVKAKKGK